MVERATDPFPPSALAPMQCDFAPFTSRDRVSLFILDFGLTLSITWAYVLGLDVSLLLPCGPSVIAEAWPCYQMRSHGKKEVSVIPACPQRPKGADKPSAPLRAWF